jgi:hypothetical protein
MNKEAVLDYLIEYHKRGMPHIIERDIKVAYTNRRIVSIIGPRRAGKTYFFYQLISKDKEKCLYLNFEDTRLMEVNFKEIRDIIRLYNEIVEYEPLYIFFDEVQNIDNWEHALRELLDTNKFTLFVTGSSSKLLSREIATSLRGRTLTYHLLPFSFREYLKAKDINLGLISKDEAVNIKKALREYLEFGGFPEVVLESEKERILKEFYELILFKDVVERHNLKNISLARFLLSFFLQNFSKEITINRISNFFKSQGRSFGKNTLYDYVDKLEDSIAIFFLPRYSPKIYIREAWPKKIYLCDTGISKLVRFYEDLGKLMENAVFLELIRRKNEAPLSEVYYLKLQDKEVDFLIKEGVDVKQLIQVCFNIDEQDVKMREIRALVSASYKLNCTELVIITWDYEKEEVFKERKIIFIPLWKWLLRF